VRGSDVQAANRTGGVAGRLETGDTLTLTWTRPMSASTLIAGWSGSGTATVYARLRDGSTAGLSSQNDVLDFWLNANATGATGLGTIYLGGDYVRTNKTVTFPATAALSSVTVNGIAAGQLVMTLGAASNGGVRTWSAGGTMVWNPSATATDTTGIKTSTAPISESGATDRDF
jgi:hypothetical protein